MKTRNGFVSNSSSSSFVIIGRKISFEGIEEANLKQVYVRGDDFGEGEDFFPLTKEIYDFLKKHRSELTDDLDDRMLFYKVFWMSKPEEHQIDKKTLRTIEKCLPDEHLCDQLILDISYHGTKDLSDFRRQYCPDIEGQLPLPKGRGL